MTTTNGEQVIKRDEYTVGMRVRLRNGGTEVVNSTLSSGGFDTAHNDGDGGYAYKRNGEVHLIGAGNHPVDIIGEVVATAPNTQSATKAKRVDFTASEERVYDDGMRIKDGRVDSKTMAALLDDRRYAERAISRLKAWGKHYGREV